MSNVIRNGVPWFDQNDEPVNAQAGNLVQVGNRFYLFGEYKTNKENKFIGFSRYSSEDLSHWKFEGLALSPQPDGILGPNRIGERVKVLQTQAGKFVMLMHTDDLGYRDPYVGVAVSNSITDAFTFKGPLLFDGKPVKRWDIGTFVDDDGVAYLLTHEGNIFQLADDDLSVVAQVAENVAPGGESPAMFKQNGYYFFLLSNKTSWERNDNYYLTATNLQGPWKKQGLFCPKGTLTYNSQCSFVFPLRTNKGTVPLLMGDRWSFPKQRDAATQVWLPITVNDDQISIPDYWQNWNWQTVEPVSVTGQHIEKSFKSRQNNDTTTISFNGKEIIVDGLTNQHGGYAEFTLTDKEGNKIQKSLVDFYSLFESQGQQYISPDLPMGDYQLEIRATGEKPVWFDKERHRYGSDDDYVVINGYTIIS
ncbi:family 43 glycosylhydrolase [Lentilactobacillus diolivorans]|uniref:family 43 glycosylhydrolase n=1 Tax=Lentilactobacillus diolivorans TaxID=179838 RepID=UPI0024688EA7|nr:family 43 glycosylhydrolase [Lentilactobacillus diolivorans]MDH5105255.1 family 43 glycosylhydrolase [Lentilactobacillus diolivorans]